jgi:hypothetical protein
MESPIVKTFIGKHIDLSKLVSIGDAQFVDRMGSGGFYVAFEIHIQLLDNPIQYMRELSHDEVIHYPYPDHRSPTPVTVSGKERDSFEYMSREYESDILAVQRLQKQIDDLVEQWKSVNESR